MADSTKSPESTPGTAFTSFSSSTLSSPPPIAEVQHAQENIEVIQTGFNNLEVILLATLRLICI